MKQVYKGRPPRLAHVFQSEGWPLYFVTINTLDRRPLLACDGVHGAFIEYAAKGLELGVGVGRYVVMPDHIHTFVRISPQMTLKRWCSGLKRTVTASLLEAGLGPTALPRTGLRSFWQPGFFDHLLRHDESYAEKWMYVRMNPVRAELVCDPEDWRFQGEITRIDRA
ncbi:MAG: transposase [Lentisphaerae bacterium]|nr:transposase [Lentisphaerota bacterium]